MRSIKPDIGHLVRARERSALARDIVGDAGPISQAWRSCGLIVATRGIEVQVLLPGVMFSWVRRDNVEVIDADR